MSAHDDDAFPVGGPLPGLVAQLDLFKHQAAVIVVTYGDRMIAGFDRV